MEGKCRLIIAALVGSFFIFTGAWAGNTDIVINEIGAYATSTHEWIEIFNKGSEPVDLSDWKFWENNTNHGLEASDPVVSPGEYAVITQASTTFMLDYPSFLGSVFDSSWAALGDKYGNGEEIGLIDIPDSKDHPNNHYVEKFTYISAPNFSLQRVDPFVANYTTVNWREHANGNTVGAANDFSAPPAAPVEETPSPALSDSTVPTSSETMEPANIPPLVGEGGLVLNEIYPNPPGSDSEEEFIEIKNTSTAAIDLSGWKLSDLVKGFSLSGSIGPGQIIVWKRTATSISLNNTTKEEVKLLTPNGAAADAAKYDKAPEGQSYSRDASGKWQWSDEPTPGVENVITEADDTEIVWKINAPASAELNEMVSFDAADSADPRGGVLSFGWDFGDGARVFGEEVSHAYATSGTFAVIVSATSTSGTIGSKKNSLVVGPGLSIVNSAVVIGELLPNPDGDDTREYVKLFNAGSSTADLSGWILKNADSKTFVLPARTLIGPAQFLTFYRAATKLNMANDGGKVELLAPDKSRIDMVKFGKSEAGQVYAFKNGEWRWAQAVVAASGSATITMKKAIPAKGGSASGGKKSVAKKSTAKKVAYTVMTLARAREAAKGTGARVKGVVTALPGTFGVQYFYITDGIGGLQIYSYKKDFPKLAVGDLVEARGTISEALGIKRLNTKKKSDISVLVKGQKAPLVEISADETDESAAGALVKISGEITEIKSNLMYMDDGVGESEIYFKRGAKIDKGKLKEGENVELTGVLEQTKSGWQIWPRSNEDIVSLGPSPDLLKKQEQISAGQNKEKDTTEKYLTATAGGVTTLLLGFLAKVIRKRV